MKELSESAYIVCSPAEAIIQGYTCAWSPYLCGAAILTRAGWMPLPMWLKVYKKKCVSFARLLASVRVYAAFYSCLQSHVCWFWNILLRAQPQWRIPPFLKGVCALYFYRLRRARRNGIRFYAEAFWRGKGTALLLASGKHCGSALVLAQFQVFPRALEARNVSS